MTKITSLPTKVARRYLEDGEKVRVSKKSGQLIPKPDYKLDRKPRETGRSAILETFHFMSIPLTWLACHM